MHVLSTTVVRPVEGITTKPKRLFWAFLLKFLTTPITTSIALRTLCFSSNLFRLFLFKPLQIVILLSILILIFSSTYSPPTIELFASGSIASLVLQAQLFGLSHLLLDQMDVFPQLTTTLALNHPSIINLIR